VAAYNHPLWWIERMQAGLAGALAGLLQQANRHPPMTLRVNARRGTAAAAYVQRLAAAGCRAPRCWTDPAWAARPWCWPSPARCSSCPALPTARCRCRTPRRSAPQPLLLGGDALRQGARVLDACAAPGGKTAHLLERADLDLLALDSDPQRLTRVQDTLNRLQLQAPNVLAADARRDPRAGGTAALRRHPARRSLHRVGHRAPPPRRALAAPARRRAALARIQAELLHALWPLLAPGGRLLYATCSVFKAEGQQPRSTRFCNAMPPGLPAWTPRRPATCCRWPTMALRRKTVSSTP
jgi:16S rRNA (cytosine967-C5)-methyltransferase